MKKRLLAMLLCVAMVASLLTVGAAADVGEDNVESADVVEHTVEIDTYSERNTTNASSSSSTDGLISFTVTDVNGDDISLLDGGVSIRLGEQYTFKAQFSDPDSIKSVYVTSAIGEEVKMLEAVRNGDVFVTSGYFDSDPDYTPGSVGVKYTEIIKNIDVNAPVDWQSMVDTFEDKPEVKAIEADGENVNAQFDLSGLLKSESEVLLDVAVELYDNTYGTSFDDFIGAYKNYEELLNYELNDNTTVYVDKTGVQTYFMLVEEKVDNGEKFVKMLMELDDDQNLKDVAEALGEVGTIIDFANSYLDINAEANELREEISNRRDLNTEEAEALNDKVDEYESDKQLFNLSMTVLPLIAASAAPTAGASIIFGGIVGMISVAANYFWDYRVGMLTSKASEGTSFANDAHGTPIKYFYEADITESGTYYIHTNHDITISEGINVTLCVHGSDCSITNRGANLTLMDCQNIQDGWSSSSERSSVGTRQGGHTVIENGHFAASVNNGTLDVNGGQVRVIASVGSIVEINNGVIDELSNDGGKVTLNNGLYNYISNGYDKQSNTLGIINIRGGILDSDDASHRYGVSNGQGGELTIWPGVEIRAAVSNRNNGKLVIRGGTIEHGVHDFSSETIIYDGTIYGGIWGGGGSTIEIHDGKFYAESEACVDFGGRDAYMTIFDGEFYALSGASCVIVGANNDPKVNTGAHVTIENGSFISYGGECIDNHGNLIVRGGNFTSLPSEENSAPCIVSSWYGDTKIYDGVFSQHGGLYVANIEDYASMDIYGGLLIGREGASGVGGTPCTLYINKNSSIEIDSEKNAFYDGGKATIILAQGYTGGLRYYDSKDSEGVTLSASEFDKIDFSSDYLRLEAEDVPPGGPDDEPGIDCDHSYVTTVVEPTCENRGYTVYTCTKCGHTYTGNYVDATGHSYGEWIVTREPTDSTAGQRERICSVCKEREVEIIPATGTDTPIIVGPGWTPSFSVNTPVKTENGNVSISETRAEENDTVVITVNPDNGYELDKLIVTDDNGNEIGVVALGNGKFEFTMPATAVSIEATFVEAKVNTFVDVSVADWFVDAVEYVVRHSIMEGISDNEFAPLSTMSRAMVWTILARIDGETVTGSNWIATAMKWATDDGVSDGTDANGLVTREQFATMLWRYAGEPASDYSLAAYTDASGVSDWAQAAMCWAVENGIITGVSATTIDPQGTATRAQAAAMLMRFIENIG